MGTYTTNYNLFMPSVGEQGWGDLVNGNFSTIDTAMKALDTRMGTAETNITSLTTRMGTAETTITSNKSRIGTLETETGAVEERVTAIETGTYKFNNVTTETLSFKNIIMPTLSYNGTFNISIGSSSTATVPLFSSPFAVSGKVAVKQSTTTNYSCTITVFTSYGFQSISATSTSMKEYNIANAYSVEIICRNNYHTASPTTITFTIGKVVYI